MPKKGNRGITWQKRAPKNRILFLQQYLLDNTVSTEDLIRICEENSFKVNRRTIKDCLFS